MAWTAIRNTAFWEVQDLDKDGFYSNGTVCATNPNNPDNGEQERNAKLLAAAPEMLAALKVVGTKAGKMTFYDWKLIHAAIHKAENG